MHTAVWEGSAWATLTLAVTLVAATDATAQSTGNVATRTGPLLQAHAHNDYEHDRPLFDALDQGFANIEVDIYRVGDALLVGHDREDLRDDRTLQALYLDPLRTLAQAQDGQIFVDGPQLTLLIDIKSDATSTWDRLQEVLASYEDVVSQKVDGRYQQRGVFVVISGNRDQERVATDPRRTAGIDGRLDDLSRTEPARVLPWISDRWGSHFEWQGEGRMPPQERDKLREIVRRAHQNGRRVRFWATPEKETVWAELLSADVDLIGTDQLQRLAKFLREQR